MSDAIPMPQEDGLDNTLDMVREGYLYISNRRMGFQSDVFETRLLGEKAICLTGEEGAKLFYDQDKFKREGAAPKRVEKTLFGEGGVQGLDGEAHRHRKEAFMSLMEPRALEKLADVTREKWEIMSGRWEEQKQVSLYEVSQGLLFRGACEWAGVPSKEDNAERRTRAIADLFQSAATIGPQHWQGRRSRGKSEQWIEALIHLVRSGEFHPREGTALHVFANYRDRQGKLLDESVAAVEVLNIIRPMVAISVYISFLAHGLHHYPEERQKLVMGQDKDLGMFVQEVRRFYPFFPFAAARVKRDFRWQDYGFEENTLTLLDLYGTNHDPRIWQNPELFEPARFADWDGSPFGLIPQGGGDHFMGHRCAGEWATIEIMKVSLDYLVNCMEYDVPPQDLSYSLVSAPSTPKGGMVITNIRRR